MFLRRTMVDINESGGVAANSDSPFHVLSQQIAESNANQMLGAASLHVDLQLDSGRHCEEPRQFRQAILLLPVEVLSVDADKPVTRPQTGLIGRSAFDDVRDQPRISPCRRDKDGAQPVVWRDRRNRL